MKLYSNQLGNYLDQEKNKIKSIILFGSSFSLISSKADWLSAKLLKNKKSEVLICYADDFDQVISAHFAQPSLFVEKKKPQFLRVKNVKDKHLCSLKRAFNTHCKHSFFILEGEGIKASSKIVKYHTDTNQCIAVGVYDKEIDDIYNYLLESFNEYRVHIDPAILRMLGSLLYNTESFPRREIERIALYASDKKMLEEEDVRDLLLSPIQVSLMDLAYEVSEGGSKSVIDIYFHLIQNGLEKIQILHVINMHFSKLIYVYNQIQQGITLNVAMQASSPPIFFKEKNRFKLLLNKWNGATLVKAKYILRKAEIKCKTSPTDSNLATCGALLKISRQASI